MTGCSGVAAAGLGVHGAETQRDLRVLGKVSSQSAPGRGEPPVHETYLGSCQRQRFPGPLPKHKEILKNSGVAWLANQQILTPFALPHVLGSVLGRTA